MLHVFLYSVETCKFLVSTNCSFSLFLFFATFSIVLEDSNDECQGQKTLSHQCDDHTASGLTVCQRLLHLHGNRELLNDKRLAVFETPRQLGVYLRSATLQPVQRRDWMPHVWRQTSQLMIRRISDHFHKKENSMTYGFNLLLK